MHPRYDESNSYLLNNPVPEDFFRKVPCTGSSDGNEHTALVVSKSSLQVGTCYECKRATLAERNKKSTSTKPKFVDSVEEIND